jgi:hypothetical protein
LGDTVGIFLPATGQDFTIATRTRTTKSSTKSPVVG